MSSAAVPPLSAVGSTAGGIAKGRSKSPRGVSTLMYACQQGDVEKVRRLLRAQVSMLRKRHKLACFVAYTHIYRTLLLLGAPDSET